MTFSILWFIITVNVLFDIKKIKASKDHFTVEEITDSMIDDLKSRAEAINTDTQRK